MLRHLKIVADATKTWSCANVRWEGGGSSRGQSMGLAAERSPFYSWWCHQLPVGHSPSHSAVPHFTHTKLK